MKKILDALREKLKKSGTVGFAAIIIVFGVALLLLPGGEKEAAPERPPPEETPGEARFSVEETERRFEETLGQIEGAGRVAVMLTLRSDGETFLATDKSYADRGEGAGREQREDAVIVGSGGSVEAPVVVKRGYPEYLGALVVAEGAGDPEVKLRLLGAVTSLTGLGADRVQVTPMRRSAGIGRADVG
ncbi:MAG: stage III sporulation protein AG [Oscillospiraceae bacterium]|nr:stage III sporulation protein AG [Oscillospiraceae bacterium]